MPVKKYNADSLQYMNIFKRITRVLPTDYFAADNNLIFIVNKAMVGAALGKAGKNIKQLRNAFNKNIKIVGAGSKAEELVANFLFPIKAKNILIEENMLNLEFNRSSERRILLNNRQNKLRILKQVVKRYFPMISNIKVL